MALANTRPVTQLPVHSPHTEFSEINLNHQSKIKLSPSQILKSKAKNYLIRSNANDSIKNATNKEGFSELLEAPASRVDSGLKDIKTENSATGDTNRSNKSSAAFVEPVLKDKENYERLNHGSESVSGENSPVSSLSVSSSRSSSLNLPFISLTDADINDKPKALSSDDSNQDSLPANVTSASTATSSSSPSSSLAAPPAEKPKRKYNINPDRQRANKANKINVAATGISTTIPVTGERPKPEKDASLEDDVLFTIFQILYDHDAPGKGMTVKQICDVLLSQHPETAKLSTKTSNLVSAKLNAYVKRVEKGEKNLIYALSREWADTSPKRMVYVYRGLLTSDFYVHALAAMKNLEENFDDKNGANGETFHNKSKSISEGASDAKMRKKKSMSDMSTTSGRKLSIAEGIEKEDTTMSDVNNGGATSGNPKLTFNTNLFSNDTHIDLRITPLSIPYNADAIPSLLDPSISNSSSVTTANSDSLDRVYESPAVSDYDFDELDSFDDATNGYDDDEDDDDDEEEQQKRGSATKYLKIRRKDKRSNSGSLKYPSKLIKRVKNITAAAAAPRVPKNISNTPSPSIVMAAAASLRAAALHALSPSDFRTGAAATSSSPLGPPSGAKPDSAQAGNGSTRWIQTVREGFLSQEIGTPEDISLAELDSLFK